jgi:hypothetical protein
MAALQYVDVPGYSALLLRKTYPELSQPGGLMDRAQEWLAGQGPRWKETEHTWAFPSGAKLAFGYLQRATDRYRYQGAEFDFVGFDELTHFDEVDYRYLFSRLRRREGSRIPARMRAATNPGGRGHRWVRRRFIDREPDPDDVADTPEKCAARIFIPARLADNPGVDIKAYMRALEELDEQSRLQLLEGDWNAREPGNWVFDHRAIEAAEELGRELDARREVDDLAPPHGGSIQLGIDWGIGTTHSLVIWPLAGGGIYVPPAELAVSRGEPSELTRQMLALAAQFDYQLDEARYDAAGAQQMETFAVVAPQSVSLYRVDFNRRKKRTIGFLRRLFRRTAEGKDHQVIAISPGNRELLRQLGGLQQDELGNVVKGDDHGPDALIAGAWPVAAEFPDVTLGGR